MTLVFPLDNIPTYPTPFTACRYVAPFSRSQGGVVFNTRALQFVFGSDPLQCTC